MATIALQMIVRNEERIIERALRSYSGWIDLAIIYDTGSTDGTEQVIEKITPELEYRVLYQKKNSKSEFKDFSSARNMALDYSEKFVPDWDWMLLADADMELIDIYPRISPILDFMGPQVLTVEQHSKNLIYRNIRLIHRDILRGSRYIGRTHEYLQTPQPSADSFLLKFWDYADGSNRVDKTERDIRLLLEDWEDERMAPMRPRTAFYLGQVLREAERYDEAIPWYITRYEMVQTWEEERWYSCYGLVKCFLAKGDEYTASVWRTTAGKLNPDRMEPIKAMEDYCLRKGEGTLAIAYHHAREGKRMPIRGLFLEPSAYLER